MNLTKDEKKYASYFKDMKLNPTDMNSFVEGLYKLATVNKSIEIATINWLKMGLITNNKHLVDASFSHLPLTDKSIQEAIEFGIENKDGINTKLMFKIAKHIVDRQYSEKYEDQKNINTLKYLTERIKDVFQKSTDTNKHIAQMREKLNSSPTSQIKLTK